MSGNRRSLFITCLIVGVVLCLCVGVLGAAGVFAYLVPVASFNNPFSPSETEQIIPQVGETQISPQPGVIPEEIQRQMEEIQNQVSQVRGLKPLGEVSQALLSREELRQRMIDDFNEDYSPEEAQDDAVELFAFGLLEADFDLYNLYIELYSEQIAGFYTFEEKMMYIVQGSGFQGPERLTYAHEFVHVLQDQHYQIVEGLNYSDEACEIDSEHCAAVQALIEGDASLTEIQWFLNHATQNDRKELQEYFFNQESPILDEAPPFIRESLLFPYTRGAEFVEYLYEQGGWEAIDAAYMNLPKSTEQIMHPERYPHDQPVEVDLPDFLPVLGEGWREISRNVLGEYYTYLVLAHGKDQQARLEEPDALDAAQGWGGDAYLVYYNDDRGDIILILQIEWETPSEAVEYTQAFINHTSLRFGEPVTMLDGVWVWRADQSTTRFTRIGALTTWIFATDASFIDLVQEELGNP